MDEQRILSRQQAYSITADEVLAEAPDLRVVLLTLGPGEAVPWHWHTAVSDEIFCLEGTLEVEARVPRERHVLAPGERCSVAPKRAHVVRNAGDGLCRYLIVQGGGAYDFHKVGDAPA
jgi:quercetin dioxygenase-like cupin family protein